MSSGPIVPMILEKKRCGGFSAKLIGAGSKKAAPVLSRFICQSMMPMHSRLRFDANAELEGNFFFSSQLSDSSLSYKSTYSIGKKFESGTINRTPQMRNAKLGESEVHGRTHRANYPSNIRLKKV